MKHGNFTLRLSDSTRNQELLTKNEKRIFSIEKSSLINPSQEMISTTPPETGLLYALAKCGRLNTTRSHKQKEIFEYVVVYKPTGKKFSVDEGRIIIS